MHSKASQRGLKDLIFIKKKVNEVQTLTKKSWLFLLTKQKRTDNEHNKHNTKTKNGQLGL